MKVVINDAGAMGTAVAVILAEAGHDVTLVINPFDYPHLEMLLCFQRTGTNYKKKRENDLHLPGVMLPQGIKFEDTAVPLDKADAVFLAVPSKFVNSVYLKMLEKLGRNTTLVLLSKGFNDCERIPWGLALRNNLRESKGSSNFAVLAGYTPAEGLAVSNLTRRSYAASAASGNISAIKKLRALFRGTRLGIIGTTDVAGVSWGGPLKAAYCVGYGILEELRKNARNPEKAGYLSGKYLGECALSEMNTFLNYAGAKASALYSPAVEKDFYLSSVGELSWESRNVSFGKFLGKFQKADDIRKYAGKYTVEGYGALKILYDIAQKHSLPTPLLHSIHAICEFGQSPGVLGDIVELCLTQKAR